MKNIIQPKFAHKKKAGPQGSAKKMAPAFAGAILIINLM